MTQAQKMSRRTSTLKTSRLGNNDVNPTLRGVMQQPKKKNLPVCPLYGSGHHMNSCKVILAQAKSMISTWSTAPGGGAGHVRFQGANKRLAEGKELNALVSNTAK